MAVRIAEDVLVKKFGSRIKDERPFTAVLRDDVWHVSGDQHCPVPMCFGAAATVDISRADGRILAVHGPQK